MEKTEQTPVAEENAIAFVHLYGNYEIKETTDFEAAGALLNNAKDHLKRISAAFEPSVKAAYEAHKTAKALQKRASEPVEKFISLISGRMSAWYERDRKEKDRLALEMQKALDEQAKREREKKVKDHLEWGEKAEADALAAQPIHAPVVTNGPAKVDGIAVVEVWDAEIAEFGFLIAAVAAGEVSIQAIQPDMVFIKAQARALGEAMRYPGVRVFKRASIRDSRR